MSIVNQLIQHPVFIEEVKSQIVSRVVGFNVDAYDSKGGLNEGTVANYELDSDPNFDAADGGELQWSIPFEGHGEATIHFKTGDGEYGENTADGPYEGYVEVVFPPDTLNEDDFERIVSEVEIDVNLESADIKVEGPPLDEDEEFDE
jgi:hypothetical protein